jgi:hypothetical protein
MERVVFSISVAYLIVAFDVARRVDAAALDGAAGSQFGVALRVLAAALAWPCELWRMLRRDRENRFRD